MTLLILLISIAALEYVLRRPDPTPRRHNEPFENQEFNAAAPAAAPDSAPSLAPSLAQLGRVVEEFGRGPEPRSGQPPGTQATPHVSMEERKT
jgi:hypothetical protein